MGSKGVLTWFGFPVEKVGGRVNLCFGGGAWPETVEGGKYMAVQKSGIFFVRGLFSHHFFCLFRFSGKVCSMRLYIDLFIGVFFFF